MLEFFSTNLRLKKGFEWAKEMAKSYAHDNDDEVGLWYEAALPQRNAFCIRDVSHQRVGASVLGLSRHTYNMFYKFAESISKSRDYCMFWEINKDGLPAPVDYTNDRDFWYNLPANFDMVGAIYEEYLYSGNESYLIDPVFLDFYRLTFNEYIATWDKDGDGILEYYKSYGRRGLSSYNEQKIKPYTGGDLLGAMYKGFQSYAKILALKGELNESEIFVQKAEKIKETYLNEWQRNAKFYGAKVTKNRFYKKYYNEGHFLPIYFGLLEGTKYLDSAIKRIFKNGASCVEGYTYFPQMCYKSGYLNEGLSYLLYLADEKTKRREYPEVSFCFLGSLVTQHMGIFANEKGEICTKPMFSDPTEISEVKNLTIRDYFIDVKHLGQNQTILTNLSDKAFVWKSYSQDGIKELIVEPEATVSSQN